LLKPAMVEITIGKKLIVVPSAIFDAGQPEKQHVQRQKQDDRYRIDAGEQRIEDPDGVARAADKETNDGAAGRCKHEGYRKLGQCHAKVWQIFAAAQNIEKLLPDGDGVRQQQAIDAPAIGREIPEREQAGEKADLDQPATEALGVFAAPGHQAFPPRVAETVLRISSCNNS
jgi:hypothetical protein